MSTPGSQGDRGDSGAFDEAENLRQNLEWYAADRARKERNRTIHKAIGEVQGKTAAQQRQWLEANKDPHLLRGVFGYLHATVKREIVQSAEEEVLRSARAREDPPLWKLADVQTFLLNAIPRGQRVPAKTVIEKAIGAGISTRTLYRAKAKLRIRSKRVGFGPSGHFVWFLPGGNH